MINNVKVVGLKEHVTLLYHSWITANITQKRSTAAYITALHIFYFYFML